MDGNAPHLYLPGGELYRAVPVYLSADGVEHSVNNVEPFQLGCSCSRLGSKCSRSSDCTCPKHVHASADGVCLDNECAACVADPRTCMWYPGCECRRNATITGQEYFGCGPQCHGEEHTTKGQYDLVPRHDLIDVRVTQDKGFGVYATGVIEEGQAVGVYSGLMITGSESLERDGFLAINPPGSLGVQAYLELAAPLAQVPVVAAGDHEEWDEIRAAHITGGQPWCLVSWTGHRIMTWEPAARFNPLPISLDGLTSDEGDQPVLHAASMSGYGMSVGELRSLTCCDDCDPESDGFNYSLMIDAVTFGSFTRYINHSCSPNMDVIVLRLGSHPRALAVPLIVGKRRGVQIGEELTFSYWPVNKISRASRIALKTARDQAGQQDEENYCRCSERYCSGWTALPPRDALVAAAVPERICDLLYG